MGYRRANLTISTTLLVGVVVVVLALCLRPAVGGIVVVLLSVWIRTLAIGIVGAIVLIIVLIVVLRPDVSGKGRCKRGCRA